MATSRLGKRALLSSKPWHTRKTIYSSSIHEDGGSKANINERFWQLGLGQSMHTSHGIMISNTKMSLFSNKLPLSVNAGSMLCKPWHCFSKGVVSHVAENIEGMDGDKLYNENGLEHIEVAEINRVQKVVEEVFGYDRNMEAVLDLCKVKLTHSLVYHVLDRYSNAWVPAARFFLWAGKQNGFVHNSLTYNALLKVYSRAKKCKKMFTLIREMGSKKALLNLQTFDIAIKGFCNGKCVQQAFKMLNVMQKHRLCPDTDTFNLLLFSLGRARLADEAHYLFEKLRKKYTPNAKTYCILISAWCDVRNIKEAGLLWNQMVDEGFKPDIVAHNAMLDGLLKGGLHTRAYKLFELMKRNNVCPDHRTYIILITDFIKGGRMDEAIRYFRELQQNGGNVPAVVYSKLIGGFGKIYQDYGVKDAFRLFQEMKDKGIQPNCQTYNALIGVVSHHKKFTVACKLYMEMIDSGITPNIVTYNMLMKLFIRKKRPQMVYETWNQRAKNGCCPDIVSYTLLIRALIMDGRCEEACKHIERMMDKGMKIPRFDTNVFYSQFSKRGKRHIFEELAEKMKHKGKLDISDTFLKIDARIRAKARVEGNYETYKIRRRSGKYPLAVQKRMAPWI